MKHSIWEVGAAFCVCAALAIPSAARAQKFPDRPVRILEPYAPGGPSDVGARLMANALGRHLGQSVFVENKAGAAGLVGTEMYMNVEADGYTLLVGAIGPLSIIPGSRAVKYDPVKDFVPLALVWKSSQVLVVNPKLGMKTLADFIAYAKANPGKLNVGSAGTGSVTHMSIELLKQEAHVNVVHVPFRSTGDVLPNVIGGQIDAAFIDATLAPEYAKGGQLTALAITAGERSKQLPDVPTTAEAGFPGVDTQNWFGIVASPKTPPDRLARLKAAAAATLADPEYINAVTKQGLALKDWDADSFGRLIAAEVVKWKPIVQAAGLKL